jgi:hypothetical protein
LARAHLVDSDEQRPSDGHAVVLFPGLGADRTFMTPLAKHCERLGYACHHWGRGRNTGPTGSLAAWLRDLADDIDDMVGSDSETVTLIGWSLGGLYAREVAKALPGRVRQVITLGTPSADVSGSTNVGWLYELLNGGPAAMSRSLATTLKTPPPVPVTSIYSRSDGIVAWQACCVPPGARAENIEVESSHLGLVWHPDVLEIVADRLSQAEGNWTAWERRAKRTGERRIVQERFETSTSDSSE